MEGGAFQVNESKRSGIQLRTRQPSLPRAGWDGGRKYFERAAQASFDTCTVQNPHCPLTSRRHTTKKRADVHLYRGFHMSPTNALPFLVASLFVLSAGALAAGCSDSSNDDETSAGPDAGEALERDLGSIEEPDAGTDDASDDATELSEPDDGGGQGGGNTDPYETLIDENFVQCVAFCTAWVACGEEVLEAGETCDDFCAVDEDILRVNLPDDEGGYACIQAGLDAYACNAALSCEEVTEYNTNADTTLCATEDAAFETACRPYF